MQNSEIPSETMMAKIYRIIKYTLPVKALIILFILVFVVILPIISWNLQYSSYFLKGDLNYVAYNKRLINNKRIAEARTFLNENFKNKKLPFNYQKFPTTSQKPIYPYLGFIILATNRDNHKVDAYEPKYLGQTLHRLLIAIENDIKSHGKRWNNISITVCNVDNIPERFFELKHLSKYVDTIHVNNTSTVKKSINKFCATKLHFLSCLKLVSNKYKSINKFVVIEDDLLADKDLLNELTVVFQSLQKRFKTKINSLLAFVQLYYPLHEVNFSVWDSNSWLEILMISSGLVFLLFIIYFRLHMRSLFVVNNLLLFAVLLMISLAFVIAIGRPHWRSAYHRFTNSAVQLIEPITKSASAILFDRDYVNELFQQSEFVDKCQDKDSKLHFLESVSIENHRRILSVNRNLFKHIGLYSAFRKTINNPHYID